MGTNWARVESVFGLVVFGMLAAGCHNPAPPPTTPVVSAPPPPPPSKTALTVVATILPVADITQQLAGPDVKVVNLLPPGVNVHTFAVTPDTAKAAEDATMVVRIGPGMDNWVDKLTTGGAPKTVVTLVDFNKTPLKCTDEDVVDSAGKHVDNDPHVWLDPVRMRDDFAPAIADALMKAEPADEAGIKERLAKVQKTLGDLNDDIAKELQPVKGNGFITSHGAWNYFTDRYGLKELAAIEPQPDQDPSAGWLKEVIDKAKSEHAKAVFTEPEISDKLAQTVAQETGLKVGELDPLGSAAIAGRDSYAALMKYNADQLAKGLQ